MRTTVFEDLASYKEKSSRLVELIRKVFVTKTRNVGFNTTRLLFDFSTDLG